MNAIILSWIMNSVSKSLLEGIMYASVAKAVWDDLHERYNKIDGARTFNLHKEIATMKMLLCILTFQSGRIFGKNLWHWCLHQVMIVTNQGGLYYICES